MKMGYTLLAGKRTAEQNRWWGTMGKTKIEWADYTFNPWVGCQHAGPGCDNCYAESWSKRSGMVQWGAHADRRRTSDRNWQRPLSWNDRAAKEGRRFRVFCASLADVFDNQVPDEWRTDMWAVVRRTPNLEWLVVTKRIANAAVMLPDDWGLGYPHVMLLSTVVNQEEADRDIPKLLATPATRRGLSCEPLLGPIKIKPFVRVGLDWIIAGGESGAKARPMHPDWVRSLRDQCRRVGVAFHFKQWGEWYPLSQAAIEWGLPVEDCAKIFQKPAVNGFQKVGKERAGRTLDGRTWDEYPQQ